MIYLFQSMSWAKLCWYLSWAEKVELNQLLPQSNRSYPIELEWEENYAKEGKALFLWLPPHSELNGWFEKRPSEILKSYVLKGILTNPSLNNRKFDFYLEKLTLLTEIFSEAEEIYKSPFPLLSLYDGSSCILWERSHQLFKAQVGSYLYLAGFEHETTLEAIFSLKHEKLHLHYSAYLPPASYETVVTKYCLNEKEQSIFKVLFDKAEKIDEPEDKNLSEYEVRGAEYQ
jgi:hypothetical protein